MWNDDGSQTKSSFVYVSDKETPKSPSSPDLLVAYPRVKLHDSRAPNIKECLKLRRWFFSIK